MVHGKQTEAGDDADSVCPFRRDRHVLDDHPRGMHEPPSWVDDKPAGTQANGDGSCQVVGRRIGRATFVA